MKRHPTTAVLLSCKACGLVRITDDYTSAHAKGKEHTRLSGHHGISYSLIEAPERPNGYAAKERLLEISTVG